MPFSTKAELKQAVADWIARTDLTGFADDFVTLAEARLNRMLDLRVTEETATLTGVVDDNTLTLPADYLAPVYLDVIDSTVYRRVTPQTMAELQFIETSGLPAGWAINDTLIYLNRPCDQAYTFKFRYFQSFELAADGDTNWLLANHPDVYLAACLVEAYAINKNLEGATAWEGRLQKAVEEVAWQASRSKSRATLTVDNALVYNRRYGTYRGGWYS